MSLVDNTKNTFALTTPLYYVNDLPHIGSAYTTMAADVMARFQRLLGRQVLLITGTDEHGQKIQRAAESKNLQPEEFTNQISAEFVSLWKLLNIQYDRFIRTTNPKHEAIVKEFFGRLWKSGDIYLGQKKGWYCVACEEFKEERELLEGKRCPIHTNKEVEWRDEENYFFKLSKYQSHLEDLYNSKPNFLQPESRRNEILNFIKGGLQDFSISRVNLEWGFAVPNDPKHTLYVWFDALLGYITALLEEGEEATLESALAKWYPINLHLIGKDILRFHAVSWPALLISANLPLPERVFGHGFLTKDGQKMGKSLGNTIDPVALVEKYGSDAVRYYFIKEIAFGKDGDFNEDRFVEVVNADLAKNLGNLLNRNLNMVKKYCSGNVPSIASDSVSEDNALKAIGLKLGEQVKANYETLAFDRACEAVLRFSQACNKYVDEQAPWKLYKQGKQEEVEQVLYVILESIRLAAYLLSPVIPNISSDIYQQLGFGIDFNNQIETANSAPFAVHGKWGLLSGEQQLGKAKPIFQSIEVTNKL
ncbi:methionine--tRNA ligase [Rivularia sp. PCC 7116]|uniref:methionine--tRNA ligase n=1 Tax=Rivularia sp. PCC 7116 TaxID=373994 RepID=UPI0005C7D1FE|nr:methionine--tRNA ligase [Rivularia sp. PCC 7116]